MYIKSIPEFVDRVKNETSDPRILSCDISATYSGISVKEPPVENPARKRPKNSHFTDGAKIAISHQSLKVNSVQKI